MSNANMDVLASVAAIYTRATKVTRRLDLGGFAEALKGQTVSVWVNAPAVLDAAISDRDQAFVYQHRCEVVSILFELPLEYAQGLDDVFMTWLYWQGVDQYHAYHDELKNSLGGCAPTSIPSTPTVQP